MILESHDNQYRKHSQYREGNNIVNIAGIANFHLGALAVHMQVIHRDVKILNVCLNAVYQHLYRLQTKCVYINVTSSQTNF